ncbi:MAG: PGF-CTERM sorting domain-containing protein [Natrialbaceae archaeon]|nr:PGF-CTERM sorting domain-containing protein [Natrialbaceae archaeon]
MIVLGALLFLSWSTVPVGQTETQLPPTNSTDRAAISPAVSEPAYIAPVPKPGDPRFEAAASDGSWVSYENPRDEYRSPYLGMGLGKMCVTLLNEAGDPIIGASVPNTTVRIPTGTATRWHSNGAPFTVEFPLTDHYEFPLDADQFGTSPEYAQGDGLLDSHCIEFHGLTETARVTFDEANITGRHADDIELVGYIVQANHAWNTTVDPIDDAEPYVSTGGQWTMEPGGSHGQLVVVLQLDASEPAESSDQSDGETDSSPNGPELFALGALVIALCAVAVGGWVAIRE